MHRLHSRNLLEMEALHLQLKRIMSQKYSDMDFNVESSEKLSPLVALTLKKAMTAGWADQVGYQLRFLALSLTLPIQTNDHSFETDWWIQ